MASAEPARRRGATGIPSGPRRRAAAPAAPSGPAVVLATALVAAVGVVAAAALAARVWAGPAALDGGPAIETSAARLAAALGEGAGAWAVVLRIVLLPALAVTAACGLFPPLTRRGTRTELATAGVPAAVAVAAAELIYLGGDVSLTGTFALVLAAIAVPSLLTSRRAARWTVLPALLLTGLLAVQLGVSARTPGPLPSVGVDVVYAAGAVLFAGAAIRSWPRRSGPAPVPGWLLRVGALGGGLAVGAGAASILIAGPYSSHDLFRTGYGLTALVAVLLPAFGVAAWSATGAASRRAPQRLPASEADEPPTVRLPVIPVGRAVAGEPDAELGRGRELRRVTGFGSLAGLAAFALLAAQPVPAPDVVAGRPLLRAVDVDGTRLGLLVAPLRPGPNLVHLSGSPDEALTGSGYPSEAGGSDESAVVDTGSAGPHGGHVWVPASGEVTIGVGDNRTQVLSRPGAGGGWAVVDIPSGTDEITVNAGLSRVTVPIALAEEPAAAESGPNAATLAGPDGPECASAVLGTLLAGSVPIAPCPSEALDPDDAVALRATVHSLVEHDVHTARLVSDSSPRSVAAAEVVRRAAAETGMTLNDEVDGRSALIVVAGWEPATAVLAEMRERATRIPTHVGGTYLAPWLLAGTVTTKASASVLPLQFSPQDQSAQHFAVALAATFPGNTPSTAGFLAWARAGGIPLDGQVRLYGAAPVDVPMSAPSANEAPGARHHGTNPGAWFPGGTVIPISGPLPTS